MSDSFQYGDLILLGLIAVFVILRLRAMLGRDSGLNPREMWKQASRDVPPEKIITFPERIIKKPVQEDIIPEPLRENKPVSDGLKAIKTADNQFNTTDFINGAKLAFEWVVDAFAKGEKDKLKTLLSDDRYQHFAQEIDDRAKDDITHHTTLVSVLSADITEAMMRGNTAHIVVQFTTEQIHLSQDKDKNTVAGDPSAIERVVDVWTFERDVNSRDPNWKIVTT